MKTTQEQEDKEIFDKIMEQIQQLNDKQTQFIIAFDDFMNDINEQE